MSANNKCIFLGRFATDPDERYSSDGKTAITRFRFAVDRKFKREGEPTADFLNMVSFGKTAENIEKYFEKGKQALLETHVQIGSYEKDGKTMYTTTFVVESWEFVGSKTDSKPVVAADGEFVSVPENASEELPWN